MANNTLGSLEDCIKTEIHNMLQDHCNLWLIIALDNENCESNYLVSADGIESELRETLWNGFDNNFKVLKDNLNKLLAFKSINTANILNDGVYVMNCNDIVEYMDREQFYNADCDREPFTKVINLVYDKLIDNVNMYVKVLQEYMTDSRKCDDVERLLNLMLSLQAVKKIRE